MARQSLTTAERLNAIEIVISNTLAYPEIQQAVAAYGYTDTMMAEGQDLYDRAEQAVYNQDKKTAEANQLAAREKAMHRAAWNSYQELAKILRAHFIHQPEVLTGLELNSRTPRATAAFLHRARTLIQAVENEPAVLSALARYNIDEAWLIELRQAVEEYAAVNEQHEAAKAARQAATRKQNDALSVAWDWRARFTKVARLALRDQKQLLEALGVRVVPRRKPAVPSTDCSE